MTTEFEKKRERHASAESSKSVASCDSVSNYIPTPPDGGWGWMVVVASFVNHIIVDGIAFTFGVFYLEFLSYFKESKGKTALVGSLLCGIYLCTGPISSALSNRFGCRIVCIVGGFIAFAGFVLSTFSSDINMLMLTYGVLGGFGLGLVYLPSIVSVSYYFEKKRAIATGIAVCGAGVGTFIFAPVGRLLLEIYDWKNAMLIVAAVTLNSVVCGMLMRPLQPPKRKRKPRAKNLLDRLKEQTFNRRKYHSEGDPSAALTKDEKIMQKVQEAKLARQQELCDEDDVSLASAVPSVRKESKLSNLILNKLSVSRQNSCDIRNDSRNNSIVATSTSPNSGVPRIVIDADSQELLSADKDKDGANSEEADSGKADSLSSSEKDKLLNGSEDQTNNMSKSVSGILVNGNGKMNGGVHGEEKNGHAKNGNGNKTVQLQANGIGKHAKSADISAINSTLLSPQDMETAPPHGSVGEIWLKMPRERKPTKSRVRVLKEDYARPLYRKDIFYSGSIMHIPQFRSQPEIRTYLASITTIPRPEADEHDPLSSNRFCRCLCLPKSVRDTLREMLDVSLFKDWVFMIICISNIFGMIGLYVPFVYIVERAMQMNIESSRAAFLLSVIGTTNTLGRVMAGALANLPRVNPLLMHNVAIVAGGASCLLVRFCDSYASFCAFAAFFGLCVATWISLTSIILCDMLGLEKLTNAFGLLTLARGLSSIAGPPLAGMVYDMTSSLISSFDVGGVVLIFAGLLNFLLHLPCFNRSRDRHDDMNLDVYGEQVPHPDDIILDSDEEDDQIVTDIPTTAPSVAFNVQHQGESSASYAV